LCSLVVFWCVVVGLEGVSGLLVECVGLCGFWGGVVGGGMVWCVWFVVVGGLGGGMVFVLSGEVWWFICVDSGLCCLVDALLREVVRGVSFGVGLYRSPQVGVGHVSFLCRRWGKVLSVLVLCGDVFQSVWVLL